ncbi:Zinc finger C2H2 [Penicillium soppii]|uniref:Zinc finger C2H2 n=1 Tax=Penicillium soppii TaxID=69789 RepID=UPI002548E5A7|nr:Zinc finger C2H2 [Penicillium soppii]KAJ5873767.1 Zinc finger C2H2 [Penicillium soppii]
MNHHQRSGHSTSAPFESDTRSHSSPTYSSSIYSSPIAISPSGPQGGGFHHGLGITGCETEYEIDQLVNVPPMPSQLIQETPTFEVSYDDYTNDNGLYYPTYNTPPNITQDSFNLYSPISMSASTSYNSAMELAPGQDTFSGMSSVWMNTSCSVPTTPLEVLPITLGNGTSGQWPRSTFADASMPLTLPLLPVTDLNGFTTVSYIGATGEEMEFGGYRQNINVGQDVAQPQAPPPSTKAAEPAPKIRRRRSRDSIVKAVSASGLECPICGHIFTRRSNCKEHQKMHNPDWKRNHCCEECPKSFGRSSDLRRHFNTVSGVIYDGVWLKSGYLRES